MNENQQFDYNNPNYSSIQPINYSQLINIQGPENFIYFSDPLIELSQCSYAIIRQPIECLTYCTECCTDNTYDVFVKTSTQLEYAFKCKEKSSCCSRSCCTQGCRGFNIQIIHITSIFELKNNISKPFIEINKPYNCECCCANKPNIEVILINLRQSIGTIKANFNMCSTPNIEIYNSINCLRYKIVGECCQTGICGPIGVKLCDINFKIMKDNFEVGKLTKLGSSLGKFFSKGDSYQLIFPIDATPEEKMLLIIAGLLIDYLAF